jgi:hypothetical protein
VGLSKQDHLVPTKGPKRILELDGGGIRGIRMAKASVLGRRGATAPRRGITAAN